MSDENSNHLNFAVIFLQAIALFLSEILPFVKKTPTNGIAHAIYTLLTSGCLKSTMANPADEIAAEFNISISPGGRIREERVDTFDFVPPITTL